jgi:hypothetical protein
MSNSQSDSYIDVKDRRLLGTVINHLPLIVSVIGLIVAGTAAWTALNSSVQVNAQNIQAVSSQQRVDEQAFQTASTQNAAQYSQIETDLKWIQAKLSNQ